MSRHMSLASIDSMSPPAGSYSSLSAVVSEVKFAASSVSLLRMSKSVMQCNRDVFTGLPSTSNSVHQGSCIYYVT